MARAIVLDRRAALESTSWGLGEIMGFNASRIGYADAEDMIAQLRDGEDAQLNGVMRFVQNNAVLHDAFRKQEWETVARQYNGADFAKNEYDFKLKRYFQEFKTNGTPSIEVRAAQARLTCLNYDVGGVDGLFGSRTRYAVGAFQRAQGIAVTSKLDSKTLDELVLAAGF